MMRKYRTDLSVFSKLDLEYPPVGVKFLVTRPEGMEQLDKAMPLCAMVKEAQDRDRPFYITSENENCGGRSTLGFEGPSPIAESGQVGIKYGIFQEARANGKMNQQAPKFPMGTVNYVAFARLDKLDFEPDLLFIVAPTSQAEIVLRAASYSTGEIWSSKISMVGACAWMFTYPFQSGTINYVPTGLTFGMKSWKVYTEGFIILAIPYNWLPVIVQNMNQMEWVLPSYLDTSEEFLARHKKVMGELAKEFMNPE